MYLYGSTVGQKLETVPWMSLSLKTSKTFPVGLEEGNRGVAAWAEPCSLGRALQPGFWSREGKGIKHNLFD